MKRRLAVLALGLVAATSPGCSDSLVPSPDGSGQPTGGLSVPPIKVESIIPKGEEIIGSPTELYTRIARGALTCWFGASGPLKGQYLYHAQADPPSQGGKSEIVIHMRDQAAKDPRSIRAYRVGIKPGELKPVLEIENFKIAEPLATRLTEDVRRWAGDDEGCGVAPPAADWVAADKAPQAADKAAKPAKKAAKTKNKAAPKARPANKADADTKKAEAKKQ